MKYYNILQDHTGEVVPVQAMGDVQEDAMQYLKELYAMTGTATGRYDDGNEFTRLNGSPKAMAGHCMLIRKR